MYAYERQSKQIKTNHLLLITNENPNFNISQHITKFMFEYYKFLNHAGETFEIITDFNFFKMSLKELPYAEGKDKNGTTLRMVHPRKEPKRNVLFARPRVVQNA